MITKTKQTHTDQMAVKTSLPLRVFLELEARAHGETVGIAAVITWRHWLNQNKPRF
jgi:hypothetical protein